MGARPAFQEGRLTPIEAGAAASALRKGDARLWAVCNAPYARVLRAQISRICLSISGVWHADGKALIGCRGQYMAVRQADDAGNVLKRLGILWLPWPP